MFPNICVRISVRERFEYRFYGNEKKILRGTVRFRRRFGSFSKSTRHGAPSLARAARAQQQLAHTDHFPQPHHTHAKPHTRQAHTHATHTPRWSPSSTQQHPANHDGGRVIDFEQGAHASHRSLGGLHVRTAEVLQRLRQQAHDPACPQDTPVDTTRPLCSSSQGVRKDVRSAAIPGSVEVHARDRGSWFHQTDRARHGHHGWAAADASQVEGDGVLHDPRLRCVSNVAISFRNTLGSHVCAVVV